MRRLKGFFVSFVLTALFLVVVAFVLYQTKTSVEHIGGAILLVYAVAAFVGGMIFSAQKDSRHYLGSLTLCLPLDFHNPLHYSPLRLIFLSNFYFFSVLFCTLVI